MLSAMARGLLTITVDHGEANGAHYDGGARRNSTIPWSWCRNRVAVCWFPGLDRPFLDSGAEASVR